MQTRFLVTLATAFLACNDATEATAESDSVEQSPKPGTNVRVMPVSSFNSVLAKEPHRKILRVRDAEGDKPTSLTSADEERAKAVEEELVTIFNHVDSLLKNVHHNSKPTTAEATKAYFKLLAESKQMNAELDTLMKKSKEIQADLDMLLMEPKKANAALKIRSESGVAEDATRADAAQDKLWVISKKMKDELSSLPIPKRYDALLELNIPARVAQDNEIISEEEAKAYLMHMMTGS